jgi:hypothetical protein
MKAIITVFADALLSEKRCLHELYLPRYSYLHAKMCRFIQGNARTCPPSDRVLVTSAKKLGRGYQCGASNVPKPLSLTVRISLARRGYTVLIELGELLYYSWQSRSAERRIGLARKGPSSTNECCSLVASPRGWNIVELAPSASHGITEGLESYSACVCFRQPLRRT